MRIIFFFFLSACFFLTTSCESELNTSIDQEIAEFRTVNQEPCPFDPEDRECETDWLRCHYFGSINPVVLNGECTYFEITFEVYVQGICNNNEEWTAAKLIEIDEHISEYMSEYNGCGEDQSLSFAWIRAPRSNGYRVVVLFACCPSKIEVGPPNQ